MKRILLWLIAGTRGGKTRAKIIESIHETPANANQLSEKLGFDYKTIRHHLDILTENRILISEGNGYGEVYFLTDEMEKNIQKFKDILNIGKR